MAEKITATNREILKIHEGIAALDGIANSEGKVDRFDLDVDLVWNVAKNRRIIEGAVETYQKARRSLLQKHKVIDRMKITPENAANIATFQEEEEKLLEKSNELTGILKLKRSDLTKAGVRVPGILSNLILILDDK